MSYDDADKPVHERDDHDHRDGSTGSAAPAKEEKIDPSLMVGALIGVGLFLLLAVVYVAGARNAKPAQSAEEMQKARSNQLLREWMSGSNTPAK